MDHPIRQPGPGRPGAFDLEYERHRRRVRRRRQVRRRRTVLVTTVVLVVVVVMLTTGHGAPTAAVSPTPRSDTAGSAASTKVAPTATTTTTNTTVPPSTTTTTTGVGSLPQTGAFPTTTSPVFDANVAALWNGVVTDSVQVALPGFFPEAAYVQLKAIGNPQADFTDRLVAQFGLDLGAAHALLGPVPTAATFVGVVANSSFAHWVPPGTCYNSIGYFELPNTRVVYSLNGQTDSFGIASMISWRGEWYVVHLGAVSQGGVGVVDSPEAGPGVPQYSSTC